MISHLKRTQSYVVIFFKHDDSRYLFEYISSSDSSLRTLTAPLMSNSLFIFRTCESYTSFFCRSSSYLPSWIAFSGAGFSFCDYTPYSPLSSPSSEKTREINEQDSIVIPEKRGRLTIQFSPLNRIVSLRLHHPLNLLSQIFLRTQISSHFNDSDPIY